MRKIYFLLLTVFFAAISHAQNVTVSGALTGNGTYATLGAAFTAINGGAQTGANISIAIDNNTTEAASATLNSGTWTSVTISPSGGAARTISGSVAGPLVDLNGADNVTIDGLNSGGNSLTISNTSTSGATNTSTIRFIADATSNTVIRCTLSGSSTSTTLGTVFFSTGTATGNDGNMISNCDIGPAGANLPVNAIYSFGTAGAENSGNTIQACNVFDYFSATLVTNGILISANNTSWTLNNNRLYQTATRLHTTANTHNGISITSGDGYSIIGNTIGFANSSGTGTTNIVGNSVPLTGTFPSSYTTTGTANATRYIAINGTFTAGGAVSSIQGNTIAGFALFTSSSASTTNGILCGINITAGNVNIGTVTGNTIGATSGNSSIYTACTTTGGTIVGIYTTSANTVNIQNNSFGALDAHGTTASISGGITAINSAGAGSFTISNNTIGNTTNPNQRMGNLTTGGNLSNVGTTFSIATGTGTYTGILNSASGTVTISNNTIRNASANTSATGSSFRGINISSGAYTISNNTINNITSASTNTTVATALLAGVGILSQGGTAGSVITQNTINTLSLSNTTTNGTNVAGIALSNSAVDVTRNKIYDLSNASTSTTVTTPGTASGIFIRSGTTGGNDNIINNMISLGNGQTTNTSFIGIWGNHGSSPNPNDIIYFNSVNIEGTAASGANPSFCFHRGNFAVTPVNLVVVDIRNNIFNNTRSGGTGKHYAIGNLFNATASATGWGINASNYNVLNSANAATIGFWTSDQTFAGWQAASSSDANSLSGITVTFVNTATGDLHLNMGVTPTQLESGATTIAGITIDYDNQTRPGPPGSVNGGGFAPDFGADEFDGVYLDLVPPTIIYTELGPTCTTGARILIATITDGSGVPTAGIGLPVLYWRINAGSYTAATAVSLGSNQYQFTFGAGTALGDVVRYYIVAQDMASTPNVVAFPSAGAGGYTANPPAAATPPTTPSSYNVSALSGTYTVGVGGNYTTLTDAVNAYNSSCLAGPVTFSLTDASYPSETFPITVNSNSFASSTNTLTIKPATGVSPTISGSTASAIIILNGADYVTIDGSNGNTVNTVCPASAATRDLTITNTNTSTTSAVVWVQWLFINGNPKSPQNNKVINCNISGNSPSTTLFGIGSGSTTISTGTLGYLNNNTSFINNNISKTQYGIFLRGQSAATKNTGNIVNQNLINTASPNNVGVGGIFAAYEDGIVISGNNISGMSQTSSPDVAAISAGYVVSGFSATSPGTVECSNVTITQNVIGSVVNSGTFSAVGIALGATGTGTSLIANNMISGVIANGTSGDFAGGIVLGGGTGQVNVYNNTVNMQGTITGASAATQISTAVAVTSAAATNIDIKNNILVNTQAGNTGATLRFVAIGLRYASPYTGLTSNNNVLYSAGAGPGTYGIGITGSLTTGTMRTTLADWQTETGGDAASQNLLPVFVSSSDLHLSNSNGANWCLNGTGTNLPSVTTDIDCQTRNNPPDIGADEFTATGDAVATPSSQTICSGNAITTIVLSGSAVSYNWTRDNTGTVTGIAASGSGNISGSLTNTTNAPVTVTFTITPVDAGGCFGPTITATVLVNPTPDAVATPSSQTSCSGNAITTIVLTGAVSGTTFNWTRDNTGTVTGIASSGSGDISGTLTNTTNAPITVTFTITPTANGCPGSAITATVTVNPTPDAVAAPSSQTICSGDAITTISITGNVSGTVFNWTRDNTGTVTGIPASGSGNISGTLTNTTGSPITVTFTITPTANGCPGTPITATVLVNPLPVIGSSVTQPSTCVTADGAIDLTITGAAGPYTFFWSTVGGSGIVQGQEDQSGLTVGQYTVLVTTANGCQASSVFNLTGPGGCAICPFIPTVTANPSPTCTGATTTFTASGLVNMGVTYGIIFKYSSSPLADPYVGGTVIGTVANGSLTSGGTVATTTGSIPATGNYIVYAILTPTPLDPFCRPFAQTNLTVNSAPTIICPANITVNNTTGQCGAVVTYPPATVTGTPAPTVTYSMPSGSFFPVGTTTVTVTATNSCGTATCTFTVRVNDTEPPNLGGGGGIIPELLYYKFDGTGTTIPNQASAPPPGTTNATIVGGQTQGTPAICGTGSLVGNGQSSTTNYVNTNWVTNLTNTSWTISLKTSNIPSSATLFYIFGDNTAGTFRCFTNGVAGANNWMLRGTSITDIIVPGGATVAPHTTTFVYDRVAGNIKGYLDGVLVVTVAQGTVTTTGTGPFKVGGYGANTGLPASGLLDEFALFNRALSAAEVLQLAGCSSGGGPSLCPANIVRSNDPGICGAVVTFAPPVPTDNCPGVTVTQISGPPSGSVFPVGTTLVTFRATDVGGNTATCSFTVTVNDTQAPTITCPANITVGNTTGQCSAIVATPAPTNADNCAVTVRTWVMTGATTGTSPATGINTVSATQVFNVGVTTITYTVRDAAGNTATCSFTVTVNDTQPPVIICPANITVNNNAGLCSATVNYPLPTATDNCAFQTLTQSTNNQVLTALSGVACSAAPNQFWRAYTIASGPTTINSVRFGVEQSNAAQTVTVRLFTSAGPFPASPRTQIASATVAVTTAPLVFYTVNFASPPTVPAGTIVAVQIDAQTAVMYPGANGLGESAPSYISASACGITNPVTFASVGFPNTHCVIDLGVSQSVPVTLVSGPAPGGSFPVGTTTVTYRATDVAGNSSQCSFTVTVVDNEAPTITCPANITRPTDIGSCVAAGVVVPNPTNADNCGIVTRTWVMTGATIGSSPASGINSVGTQTFNLGVTTIVYTVRDAAGNQTTCSFTVTITDAEIPVISAQPQSRTACANDNVTFSVTAAPAGGTFNLTYQWQRFDGTSWVNIAGATTNSYTLSNVDIPQNHTSYRVVIQGRCTQVISNVATLNVNPKPKVFITSSTTSFVIRPGENISLIASVIPTGGTIQWSFNGNAINNATSLTLANVSVNNLGVGTYTATYTDLNGCVQSASVNVTGEVLTRVFIYPSPTSGQFQVRFFNTAGQQVTVTVYDSKGSKVYSKNETLGAQQYSQIKVNLWNAESGIYHVEVKDASGNKIGTGTVVISH